MSVPNTILLVAAGAENADIGIAGELQEALSSLAVSTRHDLDTTAITPGTACLAYDWGGQEGDASVVLSEVRESHPDLPFVLAVPPGGCQGIDAVLGEERTAVVRCRGTKADATILANRIESLVEIHRREQRLEREQERFDTLFEVLTQPIVETNFEGEDPIIVRANRAFEETFGYEESELVGDSLDEVVVPPEKRDEARDINKRVLDGEQFSVEVTRRTASGPREFLLQNGVYPDSDREFAMYTDISDRKEREQQLERMKAELEASNDKLRRKNERLEQFASVVSHDLRNPLTVARLQRELAQGTGNQEHFEKLEEAHERMAAMIDDLLLLARAETASPEFDAVLLSAQAKAAWETANTATGRLEVALSDDVEIEADPQLLRHILENLYRNAVEHNDGQVAVTVGLLTDSGVPVGFSVADDGRGIPAEDSDKVTEYGYTTTRSGTGFGLAIVAEFVDLQGWQLSIAESQAGGARFEIRCRDPADEDADTGRRNP